MTVDPCDEYRNWKSGIIILFFWIWIQFQAENIMDFLLDFLDSHNYFTDCHTILTTEIDKKY